MLFSNIYSGSLTQQMMIEYKASINKMSVGFENLNKEIDQIYTLLNMDIDIYSFLNEYKEDNITRAHAAMNVNVMYQINPYADSIILYNAKTKDNILGCKDQFEPSEIIRNAEWNATNKPKKRTLFVDEVEEYTAGKTYVVSLVYSDTPIIPNSLNNIVIINLVRDALQNGIIEKSNGVTFICENNGNAIINIGSINNEVDTSAQKYFVYNEVMKK